MTNSVIKQFGTYISVDTSYCLLRIYLRLSARVSHEVYRGPRKSVDFWGEEKWRQAKLAASFILQAHFDEGAVVIYYGVPCKSVAQVWQKDLFRFLPVGQGDIRCQHVYSSLF